MSSIPTPNGVRIELIFNFAGVRWENVYCVTKGVPANNADLSALVVLFQNWHNASGRQWQSNTCQLVQIDATALDGPGAPILNWPVNPPIVGPATGATASTFVSLVAKHNTGKAGRSFRGRTHCGGFPSSTVTGNVAPGATVTTITNAFSTLRTTLLGQGWTFVVLSQYSGVTIVNGRRRAVPRAQGIMTPIISTTVEGAWDTQRHRKFVYLA